MTNSVTSTRFYETFWVETCDGHEVCVTPDSSLAEAMQGDHARARQTFVGVDGIV